MGERLFAHARAETFGGTGMSNPMKTFAGIETMLLKRSEERRVGKECRSLCDWSSDVCSSDLHGRAALRARARRDLRRHRHEQPDENLRRHRDDAAEEIGRASCRERV